MGLVAMAELSNGSFCGTFSKTITSGTRSASTQAITMVLTTSSAVCLASTYKRGASIGSQGSRGFDAMAMLLTSLFRPFFLWTLKKLYEPL
jgi:hypothetical protein